MYNYDLKNYKSYKSLYQQIYNILIKNNAQVTYTNTYLLCDFAKLNESTKDELRVLFSS